VKPFLFSLILTGWSARAWATQDADLALVPMSLKVLAALAIVLGIVLLLYALLKRGHLIPLAKNGAIQVVEVRHLAPKKTLYLIEVRGRSILVGATAERLETLAQWSVEDSARFADVLEQQQDGDDE
jgi:flagellar protein FliO/FliZ